jgi:predicted lipoprotein with Yx(FWY)xxD motif
MNEINRKDRGGRAAARDSASHSVVLLTLAALVGLVGFFVAGSVARSATQANKTVSLSKTKIGEVLVNSKGHTLYMFTKDKNGKSSCSGSCAKFWPPYLQHGKATAGFGVKASLLGMTRRSNGSMQVTYKKHPLYGFTLDKRAGQTAGENYVAFGGKWYAVSAKGAAVVKAPTPSTTTTTTTATNPNPYP